VEAEEIPGESCGTYKRMWPGWMVIDALCGHRMFLKKD